MSQLTARYVVCNRPSRSPRFTGRDWCVLDRFVNRIDSRYISLDSALLVAQGLEAIHQGQLARFDPPADDFGPADADWWQEQDDATESALSAFLDRVGVDSWEEADLAEFRR